MIRLKNTLQDFRKTDFEDRSTHVPYIQNVTGTQSLRDTLTLMREIKIF